MISHRIEDYPKGWFVGNFSPNLLKNDDVEIAVKYYKAGDKEVMHYHKVAMELTMIVYGTVKFNGTEFSAGDIVEVPANEAVEFESVTDSATVVVKTPSVPGDKYMVNYKHTTRQI